MQQIAISRDSAFATRLIGWKESESQTILRCCHDCISLHFHLESFHKMTIDSSWLIDYAQANIEQFFYRQSYVFTHKSPAIYLSAMCLAYLKSLLQRNLSNRLESQEHAKKTRSLYGTSRLFPGQRLIFWMLLMFRIKDMTIDKESWIFLQFD